MSSIQPEKPDRNRPSYEPSPDNDSTYFADPVVSCRIEDDNGAILFNPDTDNSIMINSSGLEIWKYLDQPRTIDEISIFMRDYYAECPDLEVIRVDIITFITYLSPDYIREGEPGA
ncbi:MAG: PqqD family protein [Methanospirillum sp.]|nr:PqqD family protein [Methanospirillum sp.]